MTRALRRTGNANDVVNARDKVRHDDGFDGAQQLVAGLQIAMPSSSGASNLTPIHGRSAAPTSFR